MSFLFLMLKNLLRRRVRSGLTLAGIAVAVGAVVCLTGLSANFERSFLQLLEGHDVELAAVRAGVVDRLTSHVPERFAERIRGLPQVRAVTPVLGDLVALEKQGLIGVMVQGWLADSFLFENIKITNGRRPAFEESGWVMLGHILARKLGKGVGDTLVVYEEEFRVAAVFESFNFLEDNSAVVLLADLQQRTAQRGLVTAFYIRAADPAEPAAKEAVVAAVRQQIEALTDENGRSLGLGVQAARDYADSLVPLQLARGMAWTTSAVALLIGIIFMLATMLMAVFERTQEIGVLRALGWRRWRVLRLILGEALVLSGLGATAGTLAAVGVLPLLSWLPQTSGFVSGEVHWTLAAWGVGLALVLGLAGGAYPALRAASLSPADAIRHL
jgi:putative ABC transport system permease protein